MNSYSNLRTLGLNCNQWRNSSPAQQAQLVATRLLGIGGKWMSSAQAGQVRGITQKLNEYCATLPALNPTGYDGVLPGGQALIGPGPRMVRVAITTNPINVVLPQVIRPAVPNWQTAQAYGYTCDGWVNLSHDEKVDEILTRHPEAPSFGGSLALAEEVMRQVGTNCRPRMAIQVMPAFDLNTQRIVYPPTIYAAGQTAPTPTTDAAGQTAPTPTTDADRIAAAVAPHVAQEGVLAKKKRVWQFITVGVAAVATLAVSVK